LFLPLQKKEEEGDNSVAAVAFVVALRYSTGPEEKEEGNGSVAAVAFFIALQRNKIRGRRRRRPSSFCFFRCKGKTKRQQQQRCSAAPKEEMLRCSAAPQKQKSKDAYLGPAWVPLWLQPQLPCSNGSKLQAPATPSSKFLLHAPRSCSNKPDSNS